MSASSLPVSLWGGWPVSDLAALIERAARIINGWDEDGPTDKDRDKAKAVVSAVLPEIRQALIEDLERISGAGDGYSVRSVAIATVDRLLTEGNEQ